MRGVLGDPRAGTREKVQDATRLGKGSYLAVMLQDWSSGILKVLSVTKVYIYILKKPVNKLFVGFLGGSENPPASAGDEGLRWEDPTCLRAAKPVLILLSLCPGAWELQLVKPARVP